MSSPLSCSPIAPRKVIIFHSLDFLVIPCPVWTRWCAFLATTPQGMPAGEPVEVLVGFRNNGTQQYNITSIDASFNYPLDFSFYIQNVSPDLFSFHFISFE